MSRGNAELTKVWPLVSGVPGLNAHGGVITLQPGQPGWMLHVDAVAAQKEDKVQIMVGQTPQSLKQPRYVTATVEAEAESDTTVDDEPAQERTPNRRNRRKSYNRRDITADK